MQVANFIVVGLLPVPFAIELRRALRPLGGSTGLVRVDRGRGVGNGRGARGDAGVTMVSPAGLESATAPRACRRRHDDYAWAAFPVPPESGGSVAIDLVSNIVFGVVAIIVLVLAARVTAAHIVHTPAEARSLSR